MNRIVWVCVLCCACGGKKDNPLEEPWPVGLLVGGICHYEAPPSVATLEHDGGFATLVGEGKITEKCGDSKFVHDVVTPTATVIDGPDTVKLGETDDRKREYWPKLFAGSRKLGGYSQSNVIADWKLGPDCDGVATLEDALGAQDTGGKEIERRVRPIKAGSCTLQLTLYGQGKPFTPPGTKTIKIQ
jgi:hypothetical protein